MRVHATIKSLSWESEFFRLNSTKLHFNETAERLTEADLNAFELVQAEVYTHRLALIDALSVLGFRLVEGGELALNIAAESTAIQTAPLSVVRMSTPKDISQLRVAPAKVFDTSRFGALWWYDRADSACFYALWIEKPC